MKTVDPLIVRQLLRAVAVVLVAAASSADARWPQVGVRADRVVDESRVTYFVSPDSDDARDGRSRAAAFRSVQKVADVVEPGETVLVLRGVYADGFHYKGVGRPDAYVTFRAEPGVEIRGSDVRKDWQRAADGEDVYFIERPRLHGHWQRPDTPLFNRTEQVFVNGRLLRMVPERAMLKPTGTFHVDDDQRKLYVCLADGQDPNGERTEVAMRTWAIAIGGPPNNNLLSQPQFDKLREECRTSHVRIDGFRIRHLANFSRNAAIQIRGLCSYILVENCDVQWVNYGGSFDRPHTAGQARNRCWANLVFDNAHHATVLRQEDDPHERTFDNLMEGNLFVAARSEPPPLTPARLSTASAARRSGRRRG